MKITRITCMVAAAVSAACTNSAAQQQAVTNVFFPPAPGAAIIGGRLGDEINLCIDHRVMAQNLDVLIAPYHDKTEVGDGDWRGEYWGKWFTSLALANRYQPTPEHRARMDQAVKELLATAAPDGYLGTRTETNRLKGWDVWGRKYALLGLVADYDATGDPAILAAACRHLDTLLAEVGPAEANIADLGYAAHKGLPPCSVLEPVVLLYQRSGGTNYLDFARYIVGQWSKPSALCTKGMRLVEDALANVPPSEMCAPKAYEQMSCFEGLCELYRVTGDKDYLTAAVNEAAGIMNEETTIIGPGTQVELWYKGHRNQTGVVDRPMETCVTVTWMKLCYQLLRLTGDPMYADELEKCLYNGLLAAQMPDGRWWAYFTGLMGERVPSDVQHSDVGLSCCVASGPRALLLTPCWAVMNSDKGPVVNLFCPGRTELKTPLGQSAIIEQKTDYPCGGHIELSLKLPEPEEFVLKLRIPPWSAKTSLSVNGENTPVQPGTYAQLDRKWMATDRITLDLDMRGRILNAPDANKQVAVARGPLVLSLDDRLTPPGDKAAADIDRSASPYIALTPDPKAAAKIGAWEAFDVPFLIDGKPHNFVMCDYMSAGNAWSTTNQFRTWLPEPLDPSTIYDTGQVWRKLTHRDYRPKPPTGPFAGKN